MKYDVDNVELIEIFRARYLIDPIHSLPKPYVHDHETKEYFIYNKKYENRYVEASTVLLSSKYIDVETKFFDIKYGESLVKLYIYSHDENIQPIIISRTSSVYESLYVMEYLTNVMRGKYNIKIKETLINNRDKIYERL